MARQRAISQPSVRLNWLATSRPRNQPGHHGHLRAAVLLGAHLRRTGLGEEDVLPVLLHCREGGGGIRQGAPLGEGAAAGLQPEHVFRGPRRLGQADGEVDLVAAVTVVSGGHCGPSVLSGAGFRPEPVNWSSGRQLPQQPLPQFLRFGGKSPLVLDVLGLAFGGFDQDGGIAPRVQVVGGRLHVHGPDPPGELEAVHHQLAGQQRRQFVGPLVQVHVGVQAAGLFHGPLVLPARLQAVQRHGVRGVEAEGVEVRAADPVVLDHLVGPFGAEPQLEVFVPELELVLPVDHGPFVQPEAAELGRPRRRPGQDDPGELQGVPPVPHERLDVDRDGGGARRQPGGGEFAVVGRAVVLPARALCRGRTGEHDAGARVPAQQLARFLGVVSEEEVLDRVLLARRPAGEVGIRIAPDARLMGGLARQPVVLGEVLQLRQLRRWSQGRPWRHSRRRSRSRRAG